MNAELMASEEEIDEELLTLPVDEMMELINDDPDRYSEATLKVALSRIQQGRKQTTARAPSKKKVKEGMSEKDVEEHVTDFFDDF